jgi:hypothetical protein
VPRRNVGEQVKTYTAVLQAHQAQSVGQPSLTMKTAVEGIAAPPLPVSKKLPLSCKRCGGGMEILPSIWSSPRHAIVNVMSLLCHFYTFYPGFGLRFALITTSTSNRDNHMPTKGIQSFRELLLYYFIRSVNR